MPMSQFLGIIVSIILINLDNSDSVLVVLVVLVVFAVFVAADVEAVEVAEAALAAAEDALAAAVFKCLFKGKRLHLHELLQGPFSIYVRHKGQISIHRIESDE